MSALSARPARWTVIPEVHLPARRSATLHATLPVRPRGSLRRPSGGSRCSSRASSFLRCSGLGCGCRDSSGSWNSASPSRLRKIRTPACSSKRLISSATAGPGVTAASNANPIRTIRNAAFLFSSRMALAVFPNPRFPGSWVKPSPRHQAYTWSARRVTPTHPSRRPDAPPVWSRACRLLHT